MHDYRLRQALIDRMVAKQGRAHTCERFDGPKTALLVIDMQNYFMAPGQQFETPAARAVVPNVNRLAAALRRAGGLVVWVQNAADAAWGSYAERYRPEQWARRIGALTPGDFGYALWPDLEVRPEDERVVKTRFSPFIAGSSDLEARLRRRGVDTLIIAGVATNICCETTARDAMMRGFRTLMVADGCAAPNDAEHAAALDAFYLYFGDVQTTEEVAARLVAPAASAAE
jgi:ureidoacrylate peracid hydrolase